MLVRAKFTLPSDTDIVYRYLLLVYSIFFAVQPFLFFTNLILLRSEVGDRILLLCWVQRTSVILTIKRLLVNSSKFLSQPGHKSFHILFPFNSTTWNFSFLQSPLPPLYLVSDSQSLLKINWVILSMFIILPLYSLCFYLTSKHFTLEFWK